jgi:hypothetical protein
MSKNLQPTRVTSTARPALDREEPRRFAGRVKRWSLGLAVVGFGLTWGLVSQNAVGATNATAPAGTTAQAGTPGRAAVPSIDFFGQPAAQPQPVFGNGAGGSGGAPVVRGRTS